MSSRKKSKTKKKRPQKKASFKNDRCFNPLGKKAYTQKDLRKISKNIFKKYPYLNRSARICAGCRKALSRLHSSPPSETSASNIIPCQSRSDRENQSNAIEKSSINDREEDSAGITNNDILVAESDFHSDLREVSEREKDLEEMLGGLKNLYKSLSERDSLRVRILTIAPDSWSINKIAREFSASKRQARNAKNLKEKAGVLGETTTRASRSLPLSIVNSVKNFYCNDDNSKIMAGKKQFKTVIVGNERISVQKRLLLFDLRELYASYKQLHPNDKVGFSTFCKLRPENIILPGANGTHSVCVCTKHENIKMMLDAINVKDLTKNWENPVKDYKDCLGMITCNNPTNACYFNECELCPDIQDFHDKILESMQEANIFEVNYAYWTSTDRATMLNVVKETEDFVDELSENLHLLKLHSHVAKSQSAFINKKKDNSKNHEMLIMFDYFENLKYAAQNASQAFHFNNSQCTVFPVIYYYKEKGVLKDQSCVFLSDSLKNDTASVYAAQTILINDIKRKFKKIKHIIYMTDGAKQHFKNRFQVANLIQHQADFGLSAEWHFSATAHGKSAYDGIGATFKREVYRASLMARPTEAILTFEKLKSWSRDHFQSIIVYDFNKTFHEQIQRKLNRRFMEAQLITGILTHHAFIWDQGILIMKRISDEQTGLQIC